jgi:MFS family permease
MHAVTVPMNLFDPSLRALTVGMVALVSLLAFEAMAVTTAMPVVAAQLTGLLLFPLAFGGAMAASMVGMVIAGHWADSRSPAHPLWWGIVWFVLGLCIAGAASHMLGVVVGRTVMGLGTGMLVVALYACVGRVYPPALHTRIFGLFAAAWIVPALVGPLLAGQIVEHLHWRWLFLGAPLLVVPCAWLLLPGLRAMLVNTSTSAPGADAVHRRRVGLALLAAIAALLVHWLGQGRGISVWLPAAAALMLMAAAGRALLPKGVLSLRRGLTSVIALRGLLAAAFVTSEIYIPLQLIEQRGLTPTQAGMVLTVGALTWAFASWLQGRLPDALAKERILAFALTTMALGIALLGLSVGSATSLAWVVVGLALTSFGIGLSFPQLSALTLKLAPADAQGGSVSSLQLSDALTSTAAMAISGGVFNALHPVSASQAYQAIFALAFGLACVGIWAALRVEQGPGLRAQGPGNQG